MTIDQQRSESTHADHRLAELRGRQDRQARERLAPDPAYRGAPSMATWRNPTVWLFVVALALWAISWTSYLAGHLHGGAAIALNALAAYLGFTVFHESVHRTAHQNRTLNDAMGWLPALMLTFSYPVFRICHLKHHAHTNDPQLDPDHSVALQPRWLHPVWLVWTAINYRRLCRAHRWASPAQRRAQAVVDTALVASVPVALAAGVLDELLVLYWAPTILAGMVLFHAFDYLPHHPHDRTERFHDTRVQPGRLRHGLLLGQNYHLIHHLWVSVPWYRYRVVYEELEPELLAKGIRVD